MGSKIFIIGASGHAQVIIEILESNGVKIDALYDANKQVKNLLGYPVLPQEEIVPQPTEDYIIAIGNNELRKRVATQLMLRFTTAQHKHAMVSGRAKIGAGTVIMAGVVVNASASIGRHVILNTNCSIDHECTIEDYAHISPNVALGGNVRVGEGTHIGIGACVKQGINIGKWSVVGAGAVVVHDIPDETIVVGNPAKILKKNERNNN